MSHGRGLTSRAPPRFRTVSHAASRGRLSRPLPQHIAVVTGQRGRHAVGHSASLEDIPRGQMQHSRHASPRRCCAVLLTPHHVTPRPHTLATELILSTSLAIDLWWSARAWRQPRTRTRRRSPTPWQEPVPPRLCQKKGFAGPRNGEATMVPCWRGCGTCLPLVPRKLERMPSLRLVTHLHLCPTSSYLRV